MSVDAIGMLYSRIAFLDPRCLGIVSMSAQNVNNRALQGALGDQFIPQLLVEFVSGNRYQFDFVVGDDILAGATGELHCRGAKESLAAGAAVGAIRLAIICPDQLQLVGTFWADQLVA